MVRRRPVVIPLLCTRWCHVSVTLVMASTSEKNAWSDIDAVTASDDGLTSLTVIEETDSPVHPSIPSLLFLCNIPVVLLWLFILCSYFTVSLIAASQLLCVCSFLRIIGE